MKERVGDGKLIIIIISITVSGINDQKIKMISKYGISKFLLPRLIKRALIVDYTACPLIVASVYVAVWCP